MIAKITKGKRAAGAIRYDFGPGRRDEHLDPRVVAGNVPGTPQQIARIIDHHTRPSGLTSPIWRCSLSLPDEDGVLTDAKFSEIATAYVQRMGYGGCPWVAIRHGDDHIHLTVSRVGWDRRTVPDRGDYLKSMPIVRALEREHGLIDAGALSNPRSPQVSGQERAASVKRGAVEPERLQIRAAAGEARDAAAGLGREAFERELTARGVQFRANIASTGRMNGYSFSIPAWTDADGEQVWVTASKTSKDLAWQKLRPILDPPEENTLETKTPALTDPAKQLLAGFAEARRQRADAHRLREEFAADPLRRLTDAELTSKLSGDETALAARQKELKTKTSTAEQLDGLVAGVGTGWAGLQLRQRWEGLAAAVAAEAEAAGYRAEADQRRVKLAGLQQVVAEAEAKASQLFRTRKSKAHEQGLADAAREAGPTVLAEAESFEELAVGAERRAAEAAPDGVTAPYAEALAELEERWEKAETDARRQDARQARALLAEHAPVVQAARVAVARARRSLDQDQAEQQRRAVLPEEQAAAEQQLRTELARGRMAAAARSSSTTTRSTPKKPTVKKKPPQQQPPQRPWEKRQGPGRGQGKG